MADIIVSAGIDPSSLEGMRKAIQSKLSDLDMSISSKSISSVKNQIQNNLGKFNLEFNKESIDRVNKLLNTARPIKIEFDPSQASIFRTKVNSYFERNPVSVKVNFTTGQNAGAVGQGANGLQQQLNNAQKALQQTVKGTDELSKSTRRATEDQASFAEQVGRTTTRLTAYLIPAGIVFKLSAALIAAKDSAIALNAEINKLTQLFDGNADKASEVSEKVLKVAQTYGQSGKELINVARIFSQSGEKFGSEGTLVRAVNAIAKTKVSAVFGEVRDTTEGVVAAINQFNLSGEETESVLDKISKVSKKYSLDVGDIFTAIKNGGGAFASAKGQIDEYVAAIASAKKVSQSPIATVGTAFSIASLKAYDQAVIDFEQQFTNGKIRNADGSLKGIAQRFLEIGKAIKEKGLDDEGINQVVNKIAGIGQGRVLAPFFKDIAKGAEGGSEFAKALGDINQSAGDLSRDAVIGIKRIDAEISSVGAKFEEVFKHFSENQGIQQLVHEFAELAKYSADALNAIAPLVPTLVRLASIKLGISILGSIPDFLRGASNLKNVFGKPGGPSDTTSDGPVIPLGIKRKSLTEDLVQSTVSSGALTYTGTPLIKSLRGKKIDTNVSLIDKDSRDRIYQRQYLERGLQSVINEQLLEDEIKKNAIYQKSTQFSTINDDILGRVIKSPIGSVTGFQTAKGSTYTFADGKTQRNKTLHPGHDPKDVGLKPLSSQTVFVDPSVATEAGMHASLNKEAQPSIFLENGKLVLTRKYGPGYTKEHRQEFPFTTSPELGRSPIEFFGNGKFHPGNPITQLFGGPVPGINSSVFDQKIFEQTLRKNPDLIQRAKDSTVASKVASDADLIFNRVKAGSGNNRIEEKYLQQVASDETIEKVLSHHEKTNIPIPKLLTKLSTDQELRAAAVLQAKSENPVNLQNKDLTLNQLVGSASKEELQAANAKAEAVGAKRRERAIAAQEAAQKRYNALLENRNATQAEVSLAEKKLKKAIDRTNDTIDKLNKQKEFFVREITALDAQELSIKQKQIQQANANSLRGRLSSGIENIATKGRNLISNPTAKTIGLSLLGTAALSGIDILGNSFASNVQSISDGQGLKSNYNNILSNNKKNTLISSLLTGFSSGALTGGVAGSIIPGVGTLAGGIAGGVIGGVGGLINGNSQANSDRVGQLLLGYSVSKNQSQQRQLLSDIVKDRVSKVGSGTLSYGAAAGLGAGQGTFDPKFADAAQKEMQEDARKALRDKFAKDLSTPEGQAAAAKIKDFAFDRARQLGAQGFSTDQVQDKIKKELGGSDKNAQEFISVVLDPVKDSFIEIAKVIDETRKAFLQTNASVEVFAYNFNKRTREISNNALGKGIDNQLSEQFATSLSGQGNGLFLVPDQFADFSFNNFQNKLGKLNLSSPNTRQSIDSGINESAGGFLSRNEKDVFGDIAVIQKGLENVSVDSLQKLAGRVVQEQDQTNVGSLLSKGISDIFKNSGISGNIRTQEGQNQLTEIINSVTKAAQQNVQGFKNDPSAFIAQFIKNLPTEQLNRFKAAISQLNEEIKKSFLGYQRERIVKDRDVQYETAFVNTKINRARQSASIGASSEDIVASLNDIIRGTSNTLGSSGNNLFGQTVLANPAGLTGGDGFIPSSKQAADGMLNLKKAQDDYKDSVDRANLRMQALNAKFEELTKSISSSIEANQRIGSTAVGQRAQADVSLGRINSTVGDLFSSGGLLAGERNPQQILKDVVSGKISKDQFKGVVNRLSILPDAFLQDAQTANSVFGGVKLPGAAGRTTVSEATGIVSFLKGLGNGPLGQDTSGDLLDKVKEQLSAYNETASIETQQLDVLKSINDAIRTKFQLPAYTNPFAPPPSSPVAQPAATPANAISSSTPVEIKGRGSADDNLIQFSRESLTKDIDKYKGSSPLDFAAKFSAMEELSSDLKRFINAIQNKSGSHSKVEVSGDLNVTGFENSSRDIAVKATVSAVIDSLSKQLGSTPEERSLKEKLVLVSRELRQNNK